MHQYLAEKILNVRFGLRKKGKREKSYFFKQKQPLITCGYHDEVLYFVFFF